MSTGEVAVRIAQPLRAFTDGLAEFKVTAASVGDALLRLATMYPALGKELIDENGSLRKGMVIAVNSDDIIHTGKLETPVAPGDDINVIVTMLV